MASQSRTQISRAVARCGAPSPPPCQPRLVLPCRRGGGHLCQLDPGVLAARGRRPSAPAPPEAPVPRGLNRGGGWVGGGPGLPGRGRCCRWAGGGGGGRAVPAAARCRGQCSALSGPLPTGLPRSLSSAGGALCPSLFLLLPGTSRPCRDAPRRLPPLAHGFLPCPPSSAPVRPLLPLALPVLLAPPTAARDFALPLPLPLPSPIAAPVLVLPLPLPLPAPFPVTARPPPPRALRPRPCTRLLRAVARPMALLAPRGCGMEHPSLQPWHRDGGCRHALKGRAVGTSGFQRPPLGKGRSGCRGGLRRVGLREAQVGVAGLSVGAITNFYSIQYVLCGSGNDCRTSTRYIPPLVFVVFPIFLNP